MYIKYWHLTESPFLNVDSERLCYPSEQLEEGVMRLYYLVDQERNAGMLIGPYGVGKTYLLSRLTQRTKALGLSVIRFDAIPGGSLPIARHILTCFGYDANVPSLADALMRLQQHCLDDAEHLARHILMIDEAQYLTDRDGLYLIHFLSNLRFNTASGDKPLFTIILSGTTELAENVKNYESLLHRIQLSWTLSPLSQQQTVEYVQQHLAAAGGNPNAFTLDALALVHQISGGRPRNINNICDTALLLGFAASAPNVTPVIIQQAAQEMGYVLQ